MTKKVLISGYGRAGKRHAQQAKDFGLEVEIYDPAFRDAGAVVDGFRNCSWVETMDGLMTPWLADYDYIVIATPPDLHLSQIKICLEAGVNTLCEKPLCSLGQLEEAKNLLNHPNADKLMVAYNYRYHPAIMPHRDRAEKFSMYCHQYRADLPPWGLLLDHCSHDLDIAGYLSIGNIDIISATYSKNDIAEWWRIETTHGKIKEIVSLEECGRTARVEYEDYRIEITANPQMFINMWKAFLSGDHYPGLEEAIKTQELLEACHAMGGK